jgi:acyl dehydratase
VKLADLQAGRSLPDLDIDITAKLVVAGAIASRDFQDVHHDKDAAQALGSPDIFMNILTTNGLVGRYVTDWAGDGAGLLSVNIRLGAPNFPGDRMVFSGEVVSIDRDSGQVEVSVTGRNSLGNHVTGTVRVCLPDD